MMRNGVRPAERKNLQVEIKFLPNTSIRGVKCHPAPINTNLSEGTGSYERAVHAHVEKEVCTSGNRNHTHGKGVIIHMGNVSYTGFEY